MKKAIAEKNDQIFMFVLAIVLAVVALWAIGCGGGGGGSTSGGSPTGPSGGSSGGNVGATVTLTSNGVSDAAPRINSGDRVRFVNNDTQTHQIMSMPHGPHSDCTGLNAIGMLSPGASNTSDPLTVSRRCGFHDHMNAGDNKFRGEVLVGLGSGDAPPPTTGYLSR